MYSKRPTTIIGFHGCDLSVRNDIILGEKEMKPSNNTYDWLGNGFYFWENNLSRALQFAQDQKRRKPSKVDTPSVLGAYIDLGKCFDLLDSYYLRELEGFYPIFRDFFEKAGTPLPRNIVSESADFLLRKLDCAMIETFLKYYEENVSKEIYDSIRGVFWEGDELYPGAGMKKKNHIQINIRNINCIKGFFIPREKK